MRTQQLCGFVLLLIVFPMLFVRADDSLPADALTAIEAHRTKCSVKRQSVNEIAVEVSIQKSVLENEKVEMTVTLSNNGAQPVWCGDVGYVIECWLKVVTIDGKRVPYTAHGESLISEHPIHGMYSRWVLQPGKTYSWTYDIQQAFEFGKGSHKLSLETKLRHEYSGKPFIIRVQDVPFQIE